MDAKPMNADQLNEKYRVEGLRFVDGNGGLVKAVVDTGVCTGEIYMHGAHVTHFQPTGHQPVLWVSKQSVFEADCAIRGGVPICFPWFGPRVGHPQAPGHGWARTRSWDVATASVRDDGAIEMVLSTVIESFFLAFTVRFGETLSMELQVKLSSDATASVSFEEALHTYFAVSDIKSIKINGLEMAGYIDKVDGDATKMETGSPIRFDGECDRVYLDTTSTCQMTDPGKKRTIEVSKTHSHNTVVWNPWIEKSARMADFGDDEWKSMVCIETANVGDQAIELLPGRSYSMTARIAVREMNK
ncbi:D-hexose-6-phosphate mutarotase [Rubripirellula reticaptiva]|uniref:Putative glucose-6-phosphate 1-epimerase n=1 Tax=Rubripirellula reticaptiva TaxID=2528013 RepID=A0A5C6EQ66_9BACT|nr:D-hexose-6-phosphate mutarotase [Rubripirellula reticaptiva]TWU49529.1 putative glucose-6-phosphate 1-epimerase [Rubripirellula reticaptiva]